MPALMARGVGGGGGVKISHFVPSLSESPREIRLRLERTNRCGVPSPVPWCGLPCPSVPSQTLIGSRGPGVNGQPQAAPSSRHRSRPSVSRVPTTDGRRRGRRGRRLRLRKRNNFVPSGLSRSPAAGSPAPGPQEPAAAARAALPSDENGRKW